MNMNKSSIGITKTLVKSCCYCNLERIPKAVRYDYNNFKGVPGVQITVQPDTKSDSYGWSSTRHTMEICELCNNHVVRLNSVLTTNKLNSASVSELQYAIAVEPEAVETTNESEDN